MKWNGLYLVLLLLAGMAGSGCATRAEAPLRTGIGATPRAEARPGKEPPLSKVAAHYSGRCVGGQRMSNNCAHFLSDAFIRAGYVELLDSPLITERCQCGAGRPVRAQDMLAWFQSKSKRFHQGIPPAKTGVWAMYQEKPNRHHVLLYDSDTGRYYGTDNCVNWPVQWAYQW